MIAQIPHERDRVADDLARTGALLDLCKRLGAVGHHGHRFDGLDMIVLIGAVGVELVESEQRAFDRCLCRCSGGPPALRQRAAMHGRGE